MPPQTLVSHLVRSLLAFAIISASLPAAAAPPPAPLHPQSQAQNALHLEASPAAPEWMNLYGLHVWIDGQPAPIGSIVEAFGPNTALLARTVVSTPGQYGLLTIYRDDPGTADVEGLRPGDTISFKINGRPASVIGNQTIVRTEHGALQQADLFVGQAGAVSRAQYLPLILSAHEANPAPGVSAFTNPTGGQATRQIPLRTGWNLISFNVLPSNNDVVTVLAAIAGLYTVVLSYDDGGLSYYPQLPSTMNSLRTLDPFHGYWIRMNAPAMLSISGAPVSVSTPISLRAGWNLVSYLPDGPTPVTTALANIAGQYTAVTGYAGEALYYYPSLPPEMSNLRMMDVNMGYWIRMSTNGTLAYPAAAQTATLSRPPLRYWPCPAHRRRSPRRNLPRRLGRS